jgi:hypothetical protein
VTLLDRQAGRSSDADKAGEEALIKEARRLRRRRWMFGSTLAAVAVGAGVAGFLASGPPSGSRHASPDAAAASGSSGAAARSFVPTSSPDLIQPTTLAAFPDGHLLILDSSRDQILELRPDGQLSVFAGDGRLGFTGDGGQARRAELRLSYFSSAAMMAVRPNGTVDFLDDGNCRIRAINASGIIRTIVRVRSVKVYPHGTVCPVSDFAVSPTGSIYIAGNSEIERVSAAGRLVWVAGARGSRAYLTPSHVAFYPGSMAFDNAGDLFMWNSSPKVMLELTPNGKLTQLPGESYDTQMTPDPNGTVLAGTHGGEILDVSSRSVRAVYDVTPQHVNGINWGRDRGFQENGIAITKTGTIYVDNAEGNGYGLASVLVRISQAKRAALVPIRTPLIATLPKLGAPGFPAWLYPPAPRSQGRALSSCPSNSGLERFTSGAVAQARRIAKNYLSSQFASDIAVTDRSWWTSDFNRMAGGGGFGTHTITRETPTSRSANATNINNACGAELVNDSLAITVGASGYSDFAGTIYLLDRRGHPLVFDVR